MTNYTVFMTRIVKYAIDIEAKSVGSAERQAFGSTKTDDWVIDSDDEITSIVDEDNHITWHYDKRSQKYYAERQEQ